MQRFKWYGEGTPGVDLGALTGKLIVLEGPDSVGRTTQLDMLRNYLESRGHAVADTGLSRSQLTVDGLDKAKSGHTLGRRTMSLFYATDFADRMENQIIPALRAGHYVLSDRYFFSVCARDIVRGAYPDWLSNIYGFALVPSLIMYMKVSAEDLIPRALDGKGFNYWESGMDMALADNMFDSFLEYQTRLIVELDRMSEQYGFAEIDSTRGRREIFEDLKTTLNTYIESTGELT